MQKRLDQADAMGDRQNFQLLKNEVGENEIADVVSRWTGIPVSKMMEGEKEKLLKLEQHLTQRVIGQDAAVSVIICLGDKLGNADLASRLIKVRTQHS